MTLIVDPWHWLTAEGEIPPEHPQLRRNVLNVARVIEYGSTLPRAHFRETLIECSKRPGGKRCEGLLWVERQSDDSLRAFCHRCGTVHFLVYNWQGTPWSRGHAQPTLGPPLRLVETN